MNIERRLDATLSALKRIEWFSSEEHVDYDLDVSSGSLLLQGRIVLFDGTVFEITESINPERHRYRYQYMHKNGNLIFRYDNVPHHSQLRTFPHHKHDPDGVIESDPIDLPKVIDEIIEMFA